MLDWLVVGSLQSTTMLTLCLCCLIAAAAVLKANPVLLIPGDGGSQLMAKLNKPRVVHYFCSSYTDDYFSIWLNLELLTPFVIDCLVDNMRLEYNPLTRTSQNSPGVDIRTAEFGETEGVEWLDPSHIFVSSYFAPLADRLVEKGYKKGVNIFGAPYDFRRAPNELTIFYKNLTRLFEKSYEINGKPALAVAHSLGNMVFTYFMASKTQSWKDKYVAGFVALAAPLGGSASLFRVYASGDDLGQKAISALAMRPMVRSFPSSAFLLPYAGDPFWPDDFPFIMTPLRNYSIKDIPDLAKDLQYINMINLRADTEKLVSAHNMHPEVPVYCIHGWNVPTPEQFTYTGDMFPDSLPYVTYGQGDGEVNGLSLMGCRLWNKTNKWPFDHKVVENVEHIDILASDQFIDYVTVDILNL